MFIRLLALLLIVLIRLAVSASAAEPLPLVELRDATPVSLPGGQDGTGRIHSIDCNSPVEWDNNGEMFVFTSSQQPFRSSGANMFGLSWPALPVYIAPLAGVTGGQWIEATYRADDGMLYAWYHNEPPGLCGKSSRLTAPRIGALVSADDGQTWQNLGIVLDAPAGSINCSTSNYYFAGGNGDFSVIADQNNEYLYFYFSTYHRQVWEQGVAVARMRIEDLDNPIGKVWKWLDGGWNSAGLGGHVTVTFPALIDWHRSNANAFWGPSVHYNTHLETYVMLLNRAIDRNWTQEGIYVSYNENPENPHGWSTPGPLPIFRNAGQNIGWYPQVIGLGGDETDKVASQMARLFISGHSYWEIVFHRTDNEEPAPPLVPPRQAPKDRLGPVIR